MNASKNSNNSIGELKVDDDMIMQESTKGQNMILQSILKLIESKMETPGGPLLTLKSNKSAL